ncbi:hypothetical protein [Haladaptatus caseinilyticus]|uniref:hypothetical protein n=1 Tax=Haladaptatus caseinilyticus TaxID=2993314 RepID=UPI00224B0089|nr:hypothetical protein [Haladaptatus caseinilyticus]
MNGRRATGLVCFLLAIAFVTNTLWLLPHGDEPRYEYRAVELTDDNRNRYVSNHPQVKECYIVFSRSCGLEHRVRDDPLRFNRSETDSLDYLENDYRFVAFTDGFREPTYSIENGSLILSSKSVSNRTVAAELARPYDHVSDKTARVFDGGNVTMREELPQNYLVQRNESVYGIDMIGESHPNYGFKLVVLRGLLWLAAIPLSVASFVYSYG